MRLFEATGHEAMTIIADLMAPIGEIATDKELLTLARTHQWLPTIMLGVTKHENEMWEILAICDTGEPMEQYRERIGALGIVGKFLEIMNHPSVANLFTGQEQTVDASSGPATEPTTETKM